MSKSMSKRTQILLRHSVVIVVESLEEHMKSSRWIPGLRGKTS